jgi:hypothetical protein
MQNLSKGVRVWQVSDKSRNSAGFDREPGSGIYKITRKEAYEKCRKYYLNRHAVFPALCACFFHKTLHTCEMKIGSDPLSYSPPNWQTARV